MFHGSMVAIITPMQNDNSIDFANLEKLIEWHIENHTDAVVVLGTTGESATITPSERRKIISQVISQVNERIPVIVGTGSNSTIDTIDLTKDAMTLGADACLLVTPYYNKPTQHGLYLHYKTVADKVPLPLILYNVPSRTGCDLQPETIFKLAEITNIIGVKEATGDIGRIRQILEHCGERLDLYSGDDATALEFLRAGGKGVISVTANIAPQAMHDMCEAALEGDFKRAEEINNKLMQLHKNLFIESNPIPVKWALHEMGKVQTGIRLPLTMLSEGNRTRVNEALQFAGISTGALT